MGLKEAEVEPRMKFWNSLLRQEKQEKEHLSSYSQSSFRANLSVRYALWFPLTALNSGPKTYLQLIFERVIWVTFLTASFSKCNFEALPTVSVILTLNLNRDIAPETFDMSWHVPGFDIEQGCELWEMTLLVQQDVHTEGLLWKWGWDALSNPLSLAQVP